MGIEINSQEKAFLFALVKEGLQLAVTEDRKLNEQDIQKIIQTQSPDITIQKNLLTGNLQKKMGAFVSYFFVNEQKNNPVTPVNHMNQETRRDNAKTSQKAPEKMLRGCIGMMIGQFPLWHTVADMAYKAAREDTRFRPISEKELPFIIYDITALEPLSLCPDKNKIELGKHGIMLQANGRQAVFLPHVPTEQGWTLEQTFEQLCYKAGLSKNTWQDANTLIYWYEGLLLHPEK